jgi:hypothetical protein
MTILLEYMSIVQAVKDFLTRKASVPPPVQIAEEPVSTIDASRPSTEDIMKKYWAQLQEDLAQAEADSHKLFAHYGDFTAFFYRPDFDLFLRQEVLPFQQPNTAYLAFLDQNHWGAKNPFNFPGPFYAGESDTCGTGLDQASANVMLDANGCEFVFKQPATFYELLQVVNAAAVEVLDSYSSNGNDHWTTEACRIWWHNRGPLLRALQKEEVIKRNEGQAQLYLNYLQGAAEIDLRRYCYFLETGYYPATEDTALPAL